MLRLSTFHHMILSFCILLTGFQSSFALSGGLGTEFTLDPYLSTNGTVRALLIHRDILYIGGNFTVVRDSTGEKEHRNVAAYSLSERKVLPFRADTDWGRVRAFAAHGDRLYIGGSFSTINDDSCSNVAAVDRVTGSCIPTFRPGGGAIDSIVYALAYASGRLFAGGTFSSVDGYNRKYLVAFNGETGEVIEQFNPSPHRPANLNPPMGGGVYALAVHPQHDNIIFVGGNFRRMHETKRRAYLVALTVYGDDGPMFSGINQPVCALDARDRTLYIGMGGAGNRAVAYDVGTIQRYERKWQGYVVEGDVQAVESAENGLVYFSFHQGLIDTTDYYRVAILNAEYGTLADTLPSMNSFFGVWALESFGTNIVTGGTFTMVGNQWHEHCALFATTSNQLSKTPDKVTLIAPIDIVEDVSRYQIFTWHIAARAARYELQVATDPQFNTIIYHADNINDLDKHSPRLDPGTRFYWRVRAGNAYGTGEWSDTGQFTTESGRRNVPSFSYPYESSFVPVQFYCRWYRVETALSYDVQVSDRWDFTTILTDHSGVVDTACGISGLEHDKTYYIRVRTVTAGGMSDWRQVMFYTQQAKPAAPVLITPGMAEIQVACSSSFQWHSVSGATEYRIQVATDSTFNTLMAEMNTGMDTVCTLSELTEATRFYWRVCAISNLGTVWSSHFYFNTAIPLPGAPKLMSPENGSILDGYSTEIHWISNGSAIDRHHIQCFQGSIYGDAILDTAFAGTAVNISGLEYNSEYLVRVQSRNLSGWGRYCSAVQFKTKAVEIDDEPEPPDIAQLQPQVFKTEFLGAYLSKGQGYIQYSIQEAGKVEFTLVNLRGSTIWSGVSTHASPGVFYKNITDTQLSTGTCFCTMHAPGVVKKKKITLIK